MSSLMNPGDRGKLLDILEAAGRSSRAQILEIREQRKGEQIGGAGHQSGTTLSSSAPGLVLGAIKQHAIGKYDISQINIEFESSSFAYDFSARGKPVLLVDEVEGQKFTTRFQAQRTSLEQRLMKQGWDCFNMRSDSAVCMALFEGPRFEDITVNVTTTMQGDVLSAIMESPERSVAYLNNVRLAEMDLQPPDLRLKDCQVDIMGNTNYNLAGIGALAEKLIRNSRYGEVRITSSGSSAIDIVNMIAGKMDAIVDLRALYKDSWANLEIADIASMYRFLRAVGFYISDVWGNPVDSYTKNKDVLRNDRITLVVARTEEIGRAIVEDLRPHIDDSVLEWGKRVFMINMPRHPDYEPISPPIESPFKVSYVGRHKISGQTRFIHLIQLNEDGREFLKQENISFEDYLRKECRVADLADRGHKNIIRVETPKILPNGLIALVEDPCDTTLSKVYKFGESVSSMETFYDHVLQILEGMSFCHTREEPVVHGDLKLDNIGMIDNVIKLDDFGVSSLVREINTPELRGKNIGAIDTRAPELFLEDSKKSTRSDVYSIGAIIFRMLTGYYPNPEACNTPKPSKTDPKRPEYEQEIEKFRTSEISYRGGLEKRLRDVPADLRRLIMRLLDRNSLERPENALVVKEEFEIIKRRFEIYRSLKERVMQEIANTAPSDYLNPHLPDTEVKLLGFEPGATYAERLAAFIHDYERVSGRSTKKSKDEDYSTYKRRHAARCARTVEDILLEIGADKEFIREATLLIRYHDHLNLPKTFQEYHRGIERIRDADSLSFFDVVVDEYLDQHKDDPERIKIKVRFMYEKMTGKGKKRVENLPVFEKIRQYLQ
jgi:serine/threonine protein kinase